MSITETPAPAAAPSGPITLDQFTAEMDAEQAAANEPIEEEEEAPAAEVEADEPEAEIEEPDLDEEDEPESEPVPDPPRSWAKEDHDAWKELTPKAREVVLRRESDRDKAVSQALEKASNATKAVQALSEQTKQFAHLASSTFEQRWGETAQNKIDWAGAIRNAQSYEERQQIVENKALYDAEKAEVDEANKAAAEQTYLAKNAFLAEEWQKLTEIAPELVDPKEGQGRRQKIADYLVTNGFPQEVVGDASAIEWKIAWKAMRFDEMEAKAKAQASLPRRNPVVAAPKPARPAGSGDASPQRTLQGLSQRLTNSGKLDDFVALMDAEEAQRAAKKGRTK